MIVNATVNGPCPYERTWKELKCAHRTVVVTSRGRSEIPQTVAGVCPFTESDCQADSVPVYLACAESNGVLCRDDWSHVLRQIQCVSIPRNVRELCDGCFKGCKSLRRVTFGPASLLERIGVSCFDGSCVEELSIPDGVRELCDGCFK